MNRGDQFSTRAAYLLVMGQINKDFINRTMENIKPVAELGLNPGLKALRHFAFVFQIMTEMGWGNGGRSGDTSV